MATFYLESDSSGEDASRSAAFGQESVAESYRRYLQPHLFDPWAGRLIDYVGLEPGQVVLDVAAGTGAVSRAAASVIGRSGRVIASDISESMLASVARGAGRDSAAIETLQCSATEIALPDASVDVVFCQQGLPFMPDRVAVAREMYRVLKPGGRVGVAIWAAGRRLHPFDSYAELMRTSLPDSRFGRVTNAALTMSADDVAAALSGGGFDEVSASIEELTAQWPNVDDEARGILGTPFGPDVAALDPHQRDEIFAQLRSLLGDEHGNPLPHTTWSAFGVGLRVE